MSFRVLDLFAGMGGFSLGFATTGFSVIGVDVDPHACASFRANVGECVKSDLRREQVYRDADVIIASPPCKPWSVLNQTRRRVAHPDYPLPMAVIHHVAAIKPRVVIVENVPPLKSDPIFKALVGALRGMGYSVQVWSISYSDYGASVMKRRLFIVASQVYVPMPPKTRPRTVREAIGDLENVPLGTFPDHETMNVSEEALRRAKELAKRDKDRPKGIGAYGYRELKWDNIAMAFGSLHRGYVIHPSGHRPISVREAMRLMGFPDSYVFPRSVPIGAKYQMVADSVSPLFSHSLASVISHALRLESPKLTLLEEVWV